MAPLNGIKAGISKLDDALAAVKACRGNKMDTISRLEERALKEGLRRTNFVHPGRIQHERSIVLDNFRTHVNCVYDDADNLLETTIRSDVGDVFVRHNIGCYDGNGSVRMADRDIHVAGKGSRQNCGGNRVEYSDGTYSENFYGLDNVFYRLKTLIDESCLGMLTK